MAISLSCAERNLKSADEFFDLSKAASSAFMRDYYYRVALRYLSTEGELKAARLEAAQLFHMTSRADRATARAKRKLVRTDRRVARERRNEARKDAAAARARRER